MKRFFCTTLILISTIITVLPADAQVKFGLKVGTNIANATLNREFFDSENRIGFLIGPMLDVKMPILGLGLEFAAQYHVRHMQLTPTEETDMAGGVASLHTIDIPINAKWTLGNDNILSAYAATGPQMSWNIGGQQLKQVFDLGQYTMKSSYLSWNIGTGVTFLSNFRIGYTYNIAIGATALVDFHDAAGNLISGKLRNNTHQVFFIHFF